jgi:hypothetical protein
MKNYLKYILPIVGIMLFFSSCEEEEKLYTGVQVGFESASGNLMIPVEENDSESATFRVALIAAPQDSEISVSFAVDGSSTAVEGTHFTLASTSVTIPAGQNFAEFTITALDGGFSFGGEFVTLVLRISNASIDVASNFATFTVILSKESFIDSFAGSFEAYEFLPSDLENPIYGPYGVECSPVPGTNSLLLNPMYDWATQDVVVVFDPSDNTISIERQVFNPGVGSGLSVDATGVFDMDTETFELTANIYNGDALFDITHIKYSRPEKKSATIKKSEGKGAFMNID